MICVSPLPFAEACPLWANNALFGGRDELYKKGPHMSQQPNKWEQSTSQEQHRKKAEPERERNASARPHLNMEAEKQAAKTSGKRIQKGQGRITRPKTQQGNQYR